MAERRMFAKTIIDSDAFLDMPMSARLLYYDLSMRADDDGFINSPKKIMKFIGATNDDMSILILRKFIIPFDSGVVVVKHWRIHNYIRKDTYNETAYKEEKAMLELDENKAYRERQLSVDDTSTQVRLGKDRLGKDKDIYITQSDEPKTPKETKHKHGYYKNVLLSDTDFEKLKTEFPNDYEERIERLSEYMASTGKSYKNHLATIRNWARRDNQSKPAEKPKSGVKSDEEVFGKLDKSFFVY